MCNLLGIFQPVDQLSAVRQFISSSVTQQQHTFSLFALGKPLKDDSASLARLNLVSCLQSSASFASSACFTNNCTQTVHVYFEEVVKPVAPPPPPPPPPETVQGTEQPQLTDDGTN